MTVLAIKNTCRRNGVSRLHGHVARAMWADLWPGVLSREIPIGHITNGVHVSSWLAPPVATETVEHLLDEHLAAQARSTPVPQGTGRGRQLLWLGLMLLGAGLLGYALYSLPSLL